MPPAWTRNSTIRSAVARMIGGGWGAATGACKATGAAATELVAAMPTVAARRPYANAAASARPAADRGRSEAVAVVGRAAVGFGVVCVGMTFPR